MSTSSARVPEEASVRASSLSDSPTDHDGIGFVPYVNAVAGFLAHADTKPPLTLSVEGEWGSGKSSFMMQLQKQLQSWGAYTVWFNAWRHEKEDELWAAFALQFTEQLASQVPWYKRTFLHLKLAMLRFDWRRGWAELVRVFVLTAIFIFVSVTMYRAVFRPGSPLYGLWHAPKTSDTQSTAEPPVGAPDGKKDNVQELKDLLPFLLKVGGPASLILLLFTIGKKVAETVGNPLHNDLTRYMKDANFEGKSAFIEEFHQDFSRLVKIYLGKNRVFVFVDDLDRCDVPKAADLMQALNLLISNSAPVFYILGLDREKIAAGLAAKYDKLLPYLANSNAKEPDRAVAVEFGFAYLEKFIQIPFLLPKIAGTNVSVFLKSLSATSTSSPPTSSPEEVNSGLTIQLSVDSSHVEKIVTMVAPALEYNPRRIKQFINLFRLRALLVSQTGLLGTTANPEKFDILTLEQLGKLVAIELRWPLLLDDLEAEPSLLSSLQDDEAAAQSSPGSSQLLFWNSKTLLKELVAYPQGDSSVSKQPEFRLDRVDVKRLLQVSPPVPGRGFPEQVNSRAPWNPLPAAQKDIGESFEENQARAERGWQKSTVSSESSSVSPMTSPPRPSSEPAPSATSGTYEDVDVPTSNLPPGVPSQTSAGESSRSKRSSGPSGAKKAK